MYIPMKSIVFGELSTGHPSIPPRHRGPEFILHRLMDFHQCQIDIRTVGLHLQAATAASRDGVVKRRLGLVLCLCALKKGRQEEWISVHDKYIYI